MSNYTIGSNDTENLLEELNFFGAGFSSMLRVHIKSIKIILSVTFASFSCEKHVQTQKHFFENFHS